MGQTENTKLTTVKILKDVYSSFKKVSFELKAAIFEVKTEIKALKWMLGTFGVIVMVAIVQHGFVH
jgi:hypothetical protein